MIDVTPIRDKGLPIDLTEGMIPWGTNNALLLYRTESYYSCESLRVRQTKERCEGVHEAKYK